MVKVNASIIATVRRFLTKLNEQGIRIESAYLFGSYVKGTENTWSDIDVAVISPDITYDRFDERIRLTKLSYEIDSRIEPVPFRPDTFIDEDPLVWEIKKRGHTYRKCPSQHYIATTKSNCFNPLSIFSKMDFMSEFNSRVKVDL